MPKTDLKKENKDFYYPSNEEVSIVELPEMKFLMIDGQGDPNTSPEYKDAMETIFPVAYKTKFISKKEKSQDYVVMPLEGLWWVDNMKDFSLDDRESWKWTVMIRQPDFITENIIARLKKRLKKRKIPLHFLKSDLKASGKVYLHRYCISVLTGKQKPRL